MSEVDPETILRAFSGAGLLVSMSIGPDGLNDSAGQPYGLIVSPSLDQFLSDLTDEAGEHGGSSVVVEWRALPIIGEEGHVSANFTMRESAFKR